jgi:FkbM family methyltransferase
MGGKASGGLRSPAVHPAAHRVLTHPRIEPLVSTGLRARLTRNPARFLLAEQRRRGRVVAHRIRREGLTVLLEHGSPDVEAFDELFYQRIYEPPGEVDAALAGVARPLRIVDIGANIGLFGLWAIGRWPDAEIDAYEPDPRNAAVHRRTIERNGRQAGWRLHQAAAAAEPGTMRFAAGRYATGGLAQPGDPGAIEVPAVDVLPALAGADLVKIDAEGSEWAILDDPRFAGTAARAVALEYHPDLCPEPDARAAAFDRLGAAGFTVRDQPTHAPPGYGSVWAWRAERPPDMST